MTARTIRHIIAEDPWALRHLWYLYYLPMLFIPLLAVFVALSLGKPENYRLPNWTKLIYIPTAVLLLLVLTNDLHQLAFVFPADETVWANVYAHSIVYYLAVGWMLLCALAALGAMLVKCRIPHSHRVLILPFVPFLLAMIYGVLDIVQLPLQKALAGDITVVLCLLFTATLEICIQCSLIQSNTRYGELFRESTLAAQIVDRDYTVQYAAKNAPKIPVEKMREAEAGPAALTEGIQVHNMPVDGGHAVWTEDISQLLRLRESLEDQQDELQERKALLQSEYDQEREHRIIEEQNRLYDLLQARTQSQLNQIDRLVRTYEKTDGAEEKHQILDHIVVLGSFIKRRKDFVLSIDSAPVISEKKLTRAQAVAFLWRAAGSPTPESSGMPFTDVAADAYYHDAVLWAVENGITKGTSDTAFSPDTTCTRAQIVAFLWRSQGSPAAGSVNPFTDVAADAYYADAVLWAVAKGITKGMSADSFGPDASCTRAQIVSFLYRCMK